MFSSLTSAIITGGTFTQYNAGSEQNQNSSYELLRANCAPNAFHNSGERRDPPKCHHNTRVAILAKIFLWVLTCNPESAVDKQFLWIYGPAGAGKSAIAQSICDACFDDQLLLATFFFSRFDGSRNHAKYLIPTIAYQISEHFPQETRKCIIENIDRDPLIFTRSLQIQVVSLIVNPLRSLVESGYFKDHQQCRRLIVIDGLDECNDREEQLRILDAFQSAVHKYNLPLLFLIASRPEHDLMAAFRSGPLHGMSTLLALDDGYQSYQDIELFLRDKFAELKASHPFRSRIPPSWPSDEIIQRLLSKSSGQFIYAATVIKYVRSTRHRPPERLEIILGLLPSHQENPFSELDALYTHVFSCLDNPKPALQILAFYILSETKYVDHVGHMEEILGLNPGDTELILCDLGSVLQVVNQPETHGQTLRIFHASLQDFLLDKSRSGDLYVDAPMMHAEFAHLYMEYFRRIHNRDSTDGSPPIADLFDLFSHIKKARPTLALRNDIIDFSENVLSPRVEFGLEERCYGQNDLLDFLKAIKNSKFEDASELYNDLGRGLKLQDPDHLERAFEAKAVCAPYERRTSEELRRHHLQSLSQPPLPLVQYFHRL